MFFILGADDPEMSRIEQAIKIARDDAGVAFMDYGYAGVDNKRVFPGNAYRATQVLNADHEVLKPHYAFSGELKPASAFVECSVAGITPALQIDHHNEGDVGFGATPDRFWQASSIGQAVEALKRIAAREGISLDKYFEPHMDDWRMAAAADHCLSAAYQGQCPGISPDAIFDWRMQSRAAFQNVPVDELKKTVKNSVELLKNAEAVNTPDGIKQKFVRLDGTIPEAPEAAAITGIAVEYQMMDNRKGQMKVGLIGVLDPSLGKWWMEQKRAEGLEGIYGDPVRGFAGGYLPTKDNERANRPDKPSVKL